MFRQKPLQGQGRRCLMQRRAQTGDVMLTTKEASVRPVMRFLISLFSSLFRHSSKPPAAAAGFLWGREGVVWLKVDGGTGTQQVNTTLPMQRRRNRPGRNGPTQLQICRVLTVCQELSERRCAFKLLQLPPQPDALLLPGLQQLL